MQTTGTITDMTIDYKTQKSKITLILDGRECLKTVEKIKEDKLSINIDKYRKKRSRNANNYAWELITQIADEMKLSKEEVYEEMLKRYGQSEMISILAEIEIKGYLKYYAEAGESNLNGKIFKHYKVYKGSSEFDTKEMAILIDGIVEEAKQLNIETMTPAKLSKLKEGWKC